MRDVLNSASKTLRCPARHFQLRKVVWYAVCDAGRDEVAAATRGALPSVQAVQRVLTRPPLQ